MPPVTGWAPEHLELRLLRRGSEPLHLFRLSAVMFCDVEHFVVRDCPTSLVLSVVSRATLPAELQTSERSAVLQRGTPRVTFNPEEEGEKNLIARAVHFHRYPVSNISEQ